MAVKSSKVQSAIASTVYFTLISYLWFGLWMLWGQEGRAPESMAHRKRRECLGSLQKAQGRTVAHLYKAHLCTSYTWDRHIYGSSFMDGTGSASLETGKADFSQSWSLAVAHLRLNYSLFGRRCVKSKAFVSPVPILMCLVLLHQSPSLPLLTLVLTLVPSRCGGFIFHPSL